MLEYIGYIVLWFGIYTFFRGLYLFSLERVQTTEGMVDSNDSNDSTDCADSPNIPNNIPNNTPDYNPDIDDPFLDGLAIAITVIISTATLYSILSFIDFCVEAATTFITYLM